MSLYRVELHPHAQRQMDKLHQRDYLQIYHRLVHLRNDPRPYGVKKLRGPIHRIRIGDWRVIYAIFDSHRLLTILEINRRSERTYKRLPETH